MSYVLQPVRYATKTTSGMVQAVPASAYGVVCTASSAGIIRLIDSTTATTSGVNVLYTSGTTMAAGQVVNFGGSGIQASGLYFELVSGTGTFNILYA